MENPTSLIIPVVIQTVRPQGLAPSIQAELAQTMNQCATRDDSTARVELERDAASLFSRYMDDSSVRPFEKETMLSCYQSFVHGDHRAALAADKRAVGLADSRHQASIASANMAETYLSLHEPDQALRVALDAVRRGPENPVNWVILCTAGVMVSTPSSRQAARTAAHHLRMAPDLVRDPSVWTYLESTAVLQSARDSIVEVDELFKDVEALSI